MKERELHPEDFLNVANKELRDSTIEIFKENYLIYRSGILYDVTDHINVLFDDCLITVAEAARMLSTDIKNVENYISENKINRNIRKDLSDGSNNSTVFNNSGETLVKSTNTQNRLSDGSNNSTVSNNSEVRNKLDELKEAGLRKYSYSELKEMKEKYMENENNNLKEIEDENIDIINKTKDFRPNPKGAILFTPDAFIKLCMFMTGTTKAKKVRDNIILGLKTKTFKEDFMEDESEVMFDNVINDVVNSHITDSYSFIRRMESISNISILANSKNIKNTIKKFDELISYIEKEVRKLNTKLDLTSLEEAYIHNLITLLNTINKERTKYSDRYSKLLEQIDEIVGTDININITDILPELLPEKFDITMNKIEVNKKINEFKEKLVEMNILDKISYQSKTKTTKLDNNGDPIYKYVTKYNYFPKDEFSFMKKSSIYSNDKRSQIIKVSKFGEYVYRYIIENMGNEDFKLNENEFKDWLFDQINGNN